MRIILRLSLSLFTVLIIGVLGYTAYLFKPESKAIQVSHNVHESIVRPVQYPITLDGKKGFIEIEVPYTVSIRAIGVSTIGIRAHLVISGIFVLTFQCFV
jgi:hypothetical protein